jgi:hypothetical protein
MIAIVNFQSFEELSDKLMVHEAYSPSKLKPRSSSPDMDNILNFVEDALVNDSISLDPTPIGTKGVKVVDKVPLIEVRWTQDRAFVDCLSGFLKPNKPDEEAAVPASFASFEKDTTRKENPLKRQRTKISDDSCSETSSNSKKAKLQIRAHQTEQWYERYKELVEFQRDHGHCVVPYHFKQNLPLALWVKRQRHQSKLKKEGHHSTMNDDREKALETLGFVWDSHKAVWQERLNELKAFRNERGNCNVPAKFAENSQLAIWVKCQRRQYKLYHDGERSNMTAERIEKLTQEGFVWNPRRVKE